MTEFKECMQSKLPSSLIKLTDSKDSFRLLDVYLF